MDESVPVWSSSPTRPSLVVRAREASGATVLWVGVHSNPTTDSVDALMNVMTPWTEGKVVLHIQDVNDDSLHPPDIGFLLHLASKLLDSRDLIDRSLLGTVVQAKHLDPPALLARDLFFGLYTPRKEMVLCDSAKEASSFVARVLEGRA